MVQHAQRYRSGLRCSAGPQLHQLSVPSPSSAHATTPGLLTVKCLRCVPKPEPKDWTARGTARRDPQPVTGKGLRMGEGVGAGLGGNGVGPVPVGDGPGLGGTAVGLAVVVAVPVGPAVAVAVPVGPAVVLAVPVGLALVGDADGLLPVLGGQAAGTLMVSSLRVTSPFRASARPSMVTAPGIVIEVRARMVPWKGVPVLSVAELPTCQKTLQAWAPLVRRIVVPVSVPRVEPAWNMKTAFGSPCASRISEPPTSSEEVALYTPGAKVWPAPMKPPMEADLTRPAASL
jgi:hypothetical protein